jgi:hypothetical protein
MRNNTGWTEQWPELPFAAWRDTWATLHMWTQIIGKLRLELSPKMNQWWNVAYYVTSRGLTTSSMPYGNRTLECHFDFIDHNLTFQTSDGRTRALALVPRTVADFYREVFAILHALDIDVYITEKPSEITSPIPFSRDTLHAAYDAEYAHRFFDVLRRLDTLLKEFRAGFRGKCSPVHFFWGSFDLAVTRFSGRLAPAREGVDPITRDAYDEEVSSVGFWPGDDSFPAPALYSYMAPAPPGLMQAKIRPEDAFYNEEKQLFLLRYDDVRKARDPRSKVLEFANSTYEAGATLAGWDRSALEYRKRESRPTRISPETTAHA